MANPYDALMVETLHQTDQGVFKHMITILREDLLKYDALTSLEKRMKTLRDDYYIPSLKTIPGYGFWMNNTNVQGHEFRAVMQV